MNTKRINKSVLIWLEIMPKTISKKQKNWNLAKYQVLDSFMDEFMVSC